jgi:hypothetical protein
LFIDRGIYSLNYTFVDHFSMNIAHSDEKAIYFFGFRYYGGITGNLPADTFAKPLFPHSIHL